MLIQIKYTIWNAIWLGWNIFVICIYFEAGILSRDTDILNMGTGSRSWWLVNGVGCIPLYNTTHDDPFTFPTPTTVEGCAVEYFYIEAVQASLQCILAVLGIVAACSTIYIFTREDDSCSTKQVHSLPYSIEYHNNTSPADLNMAAQRPMTPRKVKQRSTRSKRGSRRRYQNPVTKLINSNNQNNFNNAPMYSSQPNNLSNDFYPAHANQAFSMSETEGSRPNSMYLNGGRPSPIYMNETDTVI
ncbi:hypothetical protein JTE90_002455 [Oedothorax gibbosus]|uniref:Sodium/potassium-transporting ATPase subunit beta-1-interacting protein n=1 Tax=Oedothorax gibbosus TaxID=931172 RepID=A0AAV6UXP1_9ARAC|nr:hypothetical protein JTE90_002455 [Oedothorax gibbosus]